MLKQIKILSFLLFVFIGNIEHLNSQNCTPNVTYGGGSACVESRAICSFPYAYQYNYTNNSGNQGEALSDYFNAGSFDGWLPISPSTKLENNVDRLAVSLESGSSVVGTYKNVSVNSGVVYTLSTSVYRGVCNSSTNIIVNIKDVNNNIVATSTITSSTPVYYGYNLVELQFTSTFTGIFTIEFIKSGGSNCTFFIDQVKVTFPSCNSANTLLWHYFYAGNAGVEFLITDNLSSFVGAKVYGPFNSSDKSEICQGIDVGDVTPIQEIFVSSGQNSIGVNINQGAGWYILEIIDDDCLGCIEITPTEGNVSCSATPCLTNNSCENIQQLCENVQFITNCGCLNTGGQLWYEFDITDINQELLVNATLVSSGAPTNFGYAVAGPLPQNYSCSIEELQTYVISNGNSNSFVNQFTSLGKYILLFYGTGQGACGGSATSDISLNISFSPELVCGTIPCPTDITIDCGASNPNLVFNGDFEVGNFSESITDILSDYSYDSDNSTNPNDGSYKLVQAPWPLTTGNSPVNNHTPNAGQNGFFMHIHDVIENTNDFAWKKTISSIQPNTQYVFESWFYLHQEITNEITHENINLYVNGDLVGAVDRSEKTPYEWHNLRAYWNSGNDTTAELKIEVVVSSGITNDDGRIIIDDISFTETTCKACMNSEVSLNIQTTEDLNNSTLTWDFGDETPTSSLGSHIYTSPGTYHVTLTISGPEGCDTYTTSVDLVVKACIPDPPCEDCIGSFSPIPDQKYIVSAWVKEAGAPLSKISYDKPIIQMHFYSANHTELPQIGEFKASGMIIDGWQRIEEEFFVPSPTAYVSIELISDNGDVFFDDIRIFPFNASMKSYVYDPINMRLIAELDERHYATFYEYDEEGKLIRIKKETEKGIMTIQETRNSTKK